MIIRIPSYARHAHLSGLNILLPGEDGLGADPVPAAPSTTANVLANLATLAKTGVDTYSGIQTAKAIGRPPPSAPAPVYITQAGSPAKSSGAPKWLTYGVVGLAGLAVAAIIFRAVRSRK